MRTVPGVRQREGQQQDSGLRTGGLCDWKSGCWLAHGPLWTGAPRLLVRWLDKVVSKGLIALMICLREVIV